MTKSWALLRLRRKEGAGTECWQLRKLEQQSKLNLVTEEKAVAVRLKEELGMEGDEVPEVMEVLLSNQFKKMLSFHGSSSKWRLGVVDVEFCSATMFVVDCALCCDASCVVFMLYDMSLFSFSNK